jgi:hypothetical protein
VVQVSGADQLSVGWCWSVSAGNVYEQSDKINLKVEEKEWTA